LGSRNLSPDPAFAPPARPGPVGPRARPACLLPVGRAGDARPVGVVVASSQTRATRMHQCKDCGWLLSPQTSSEPCPGCGGSNRLIISVDMGMAFEASSPPILLRSHRFAPEWFEDALSEARGPTLAIVPDNRNSKRREILFAVCCVEAYLIEWVYEDILCEDSKRLLTYFSNRIDPGSQNV